MTVNFGRQARILSVTSGKGGVGKTSIAVNLAVAISRSGRRTLLADCDLGMANAAMLLGLNPPLTIDDVLQGRLSPDEVMIEGPERLLVLPGSSGVGTVSEFGTAERRRLAEGLRPFSRMNDYFVIDTATGIARSSLEMAAAADMVMLVLTDEPTAFMDAYATVKLLTLDHGCKRFSVIVNMAETEAEGRTTFSRFSEVAARFLPSELTYLGSVPMDRHMRDAVLHKRCCVEAYPHSPAAAAFARIAARVTDINIAAAHGGHRFLGQELSHVLR